VGGFWVGGFCLSLNALAGESQKKTKGLVFLSKKNQKVI